MPQEFHSPGWHDEGRIPVVGGKYYDRATGEVRLAPDGDHHQEYMGPPYVDIDITSLHKDTAHCGFRAARGFPMEALLCHIMKVVGERKLGVDSVMATPYAIRIILSHELTRGAFSEIALAMANGIWDEVE